MIIMNMVRYQKEAKFLACLNSPLRILKIPGCLGDFSDSSFYQDAFLQPD